MFHFFHVICNISNFNMWTTEHLVQAFCTELTLMNCFMKFKVWKLLKVDTTNQRFLVSFMIISFDRKDVIRFFDFVLTKSMFSQHFTLALPVDFKLRSVLQNLVSAIKWQVCEWQLFSIGQGKNTKTSHIFYCARIICDHH